MIGRKPQTVYFIGKVGEPFWGSAGHLLNVLPEGEGGILLGAKIETVPKIHRAIAMVFGQGVAAWLLQNQKVTFGLGGQYIGREHFIPDLETIIFNHKVGRGSKILIMTDLYANPNRSSEMRNVEALINNLRMENELLSEQLDKKDRLLAKVLISSREEDKEAIAARMGDLKELADIYSSIKSKETETETSKLRRELKALTKKEEGSEEESEGGGLVDKGKNIINKFRGK